MFIIYLHKRFYSHSSNGVSVSAVRPTAKHNFRMTSMSFYILQTKFNNSYVFFKDILPYVISGVYIKCHYCHSHLTSSCVNHVII